jgi:hypothetical protein
MSAKAPIASVPLFVDARVATAPAVAPAAARDAFGFSARVARVRPAARRSCWRAAFFDFAAAVWAFVLVLCFRTSVARFGAVAGCVVTCAGSDDGVAACWGLAVVVPADATAPDEAAR